MNQYRKSEKQLSACGSARLQAIPQLTQQINRVKTFLKWHLYPSHVQHKGTLVAEVKVKCDLHHNRGSLWHSEVSVYQLFHLIIEFLLTRLITGNFLFFKKV